MVLKTTVLTKRLGVIYTKGNLVQKIIIFSCADVINYSMTTNLTTLNSNLQVKKCQIKIKKRK